MEADELRQKGNEAYRQVGAYISFPFQLNLSSSVHRISQIKS